MSGTEQPDKPSAVDRGSRWLRRIFVCLTLATIAVVAVAAIVTWPHTRAFYTDADKIDSPAETANPRDILWQPPERLVGLVDQSVDEYEPAISADGMTLYFVRGKAGHNADLYYRRWTPQGWSDEAPLTSLNTEFDELGPEPSADGKSLYFYSDRPGGLGGYDLWVADRRGGSPPVFGEPSNLGSLVNSELNDYGPALTAKGDRLYFSSNRPRAEDDRKPDPQAWPGTLREEVFRRTYDLYWAPITDRGIGQAQPLPALNTPFNEGAPAVTPFGDFLYFASDRGGGEGGFDVYRSRLVNGVHQAPHNLGATVNSPRNELDPGLTMGGYTLYFSSDRMPEGTSPTEANAKAPYQLYRTTSREVYRRTETTRASIDWAALWSAAAPNLMWALLALLLLLLLFAGMRDARRRKLSLLARCLLASLFVHLLLMLLFNVWGVTSKLAYALGKKGPIQVALVASAKGADITAQIRGGYTEVEAPTPVMDQTQPEPARLEWQPANTPVSLQAAKTSVATPHTVVRPTMARDANPQRATQPVKTSLPEPSSLQAQSLSVQLPQEEERVATTESSARAQPMPAIQPTDRPPNESQVFAESPSAKYVEVAPAQTSAADASAVPSMSTNTEVRESRPQVQEALVFAVKPAATTAPAAIDVAFPMPSSDAESVTEEAPVELAARVTSDSVARRFADAAPVFTGDETTSASTHLSPEAVPSRVAESSFAGESSPQAEDATTQTAQTQEAAVVASAQPGTSLLDLDLPAMEESVVDVAEPSEPRVAPPVATASNDARPGTWISDGDTPEITELGVVADAGAPRDGVARLLALTEPSMKDSEVADENANAVAANDARLDWDAVASAVPAQPVLDLQLPREVDMPADPFLQRHAGNRMSIVEAMGGNQQTEDAVQRALQWLAAHQSEDGRWDGDEFDESCGECGGETDAEVNVALTGLAMLCFLAADHTHEHDGPFRDNVDRALKWLLDQQEDDGDLRSGATMYSHGIASIALSEAYGMTKDSRLLDPVKRATRFITRARSRETGIWRYEPGKSGDTSVLGWQIMALKSAAAAGIEVPMEPFVAASSWLDRVSARSYPGLYAYRPGEEVTPSMTAEGLFIQQILGRRREDPRMRQSVAFILANPPDWDEDPNTYYWYYATLALFHQQGEPWRLWNQELMPQLLDNQHKKGLPSGSWDPVGEWAEVGGRVYQTALCTLMLEVYYRYLPMFLEEKPPDAIGTIRGRVTDATTGEPIPTAAVRLVLPDREPLVVHTSPDGAYVVHPPEVPTFFALSASGEKYLPQSRNVATALVKGSELALNFELEPESMTTVALEAVPDVHHLGDNAFSGQVNSQFQKRSEGSRFKATFELASSQLPPNYDEAELTMLVKGVQMEHRIRINGRTLRQRLDQSPSDGSFGTFSLPVDPELFQEGENTLEILASSRGSDVDDFEFVNLQFHLSR